MDGHETAAPELERLLTIRDVAGLLRVHRSSVYELVKRGELEPVKVGERSRFLPSELRDFVDRHRRRRDPTEPPWRPHPAPADGLEYR